MTPFEAYLWSMSGVLAIGAGIVFLIYRQKRHHQ